MQSVSVDVNISHVLLEKGQYLQLQYLVYWINTSLN